MPRVSVIMVVFNGEKFIREAIESILNQTYSDLELIIYNDGSTDKTKEVIWEYKDKRIAYYENKSNLGLVTTRNKAVDASTGDYIAILDSDDIAMTDRIQLQVHFLENNLDYLMCGSWVKIIDIDGKVFDEDRTLCDYNKLKANLFFRNQIDHSTVMIRTTILKELKYKGGYAPAEDFELWTRIIEIGKIINLPLFLVYYRWHGNNESIKRKKDRDIAEINIIKCNLQKIGINFSDEEIFIMHNFMHNEYRLMGKIYKLNLVSSLLKKIKNANLKEDYFNDKIFNNLISEKWFLVCIMNKHYFRLFNSNFFNIKAYYRAIKSVF